MDGFAALLAAQGPLKGKRFPRVPLDAMSSGIWEVIQYEIAHDRLASLPDKAPEITRIALATAR